MLAVGILAAGILTIVLMFSSSLALMADSADVSMATEVAREVIERSKAIDPSLLPGPGTTFNGLAGDPPLAGPPEFPPAPYPMANEDGRRFPIIVTLSDPGLVGVLAIEVEVRMPEEGRVILQTYVNQCIFRMGMTSIQKVDARTELLQSVQSVLSRIAREAERSTFTSASESGGNTVAFLSPTDDNGV